jgi:hypothetical protein
MGGANPMDWLSRQREQSRLGQILVGKRLLTQEQLARAIAEQRRSGQRLGAVLAAMQLVSNAQLRGAMRRQRNLRMAAALSAALLGPLQAAGAVAATPATVAARAVQGERTLRPLADAELAGVRGQGGPDDALLAEARAAERRLAALLGQGQGQGDKARGRDGGGEQGVRVLGELAGLLNPLSRLFNAEVSVKGIVYDPAQARAVVHKDGSVTFYLPSSIGEISLKHIRVGHADSGPSFGNLEIRDIDLRGSAITVRKL